MFRKIKELINKFKYQRVLKKHTSSEIMFIDLGSTSIKCAYKGELISFKSSIRKVLDINEITPATKNYIKIWDEYFIIGEADKSNEAAKYKVCMWYLEILILYGIKVFKEKGIEVSDNLKLNVLLPFNEIQFKSKLEKRINGLYKVDDEQVTLTLNKVFVEGECSSVFYKEHYKDKGNVIVLNIGGKTTDVNSINANGNREKIVSIELGTQYLLSQIVRFTKAPTSNILSQWLVDGYKFTKEEQLHLGQAGKEFVSNIWNDLYAGVIKIANPSNTTILAVGGGANLLKDTIKETIPNGYKVKTLSNHENIYADILGAMILENESIKFENEHVKFRDKSIEFANELVTNDSIDNLKLVASDNNDTLEEVALDIEVSETKTMYQQFVELFEAGLSDQEIMNATNMAKQTFKNYKCKYNKLKLI